MLRFMLVFFLIAASLVISGNVMAQQAAEKPEVQAAQTSALTPTEQYYLDTWFHSAEMAEKVNDREGAIFFYGRVSEYFPDMKKGQLAAEKLAELQKTELK